MATNSALRSDPDWWRGAVIYQIYPRSYQDSDGDGIGDLQGIIQRLPHVAKLGADAVWISPIFKSPMLDFGYDITDYCDIDPMFGTLADFDALIERAHELGIRVLIDLVISHTSDQHPWFKESRSSRDNPKSNWYVWAEPSPDGTPPNNWLSIFGGPAWEWDSERLQYYMHNFLTQQPDLNFHEPEVQDALLNTARFWLDRGVDGFRLDTINFYFHDEELRSNPPLAPEDRDYSTAPAVNPYNHQDHLFDKSRPEMTGFLRRLRALMNEYTDTAAVGEVGDAQRGMQIMGEYTRGDDLMHMCYAFEFLAPDAPTGRRVGEVLQKFSKVAADGWACWAFSNHDVERHSSRWNLDEDMLRVYLALMLSLRGSVCLYQGEELGLREADVPFEALQDPYGKRFWPKFKGRDGCRTPMVWQKDNSNGGFSQSKPWLPVSADHVNAAVEVQEGDPASMLSFYRDMIAWRKDHAVLAKGEFEVRDIGDGHVAFVRTMPGESMFCAFNLMKSPLTVSLPDGEWEQVAAPGFEAQIEHGMAHLDGGQAFFARQKTNQNSGGNNG
ncbi:alpha-amylase family glycosyl hydrolase [Amaricoccus tamworthensis]|uniref:alpha-amylase family glycosyl hydrolase n=1 Tax=Amaricoccus tamworthensis TaxID=57002 RepID=UPI003C79FA4C